MISTQQERWFQLKGERLRGLRDQAANAPRDKPDAFDDSLQLPEEVYIIGSGPRWDGEGIPDNAFCIALNKAIIRPEINPSLWGSFAFGYRDQGWWIQAMKQCRAPRVFGDILHYVFAQDCEYTFTYFPAYPECQYFEPGILRTGATIAGAMLQLCYHKGVKRVIFAGVDMYGPGHFDQPVRDNPSSKDGAWKDVICLDAMINECRASGMELWSLSKTAANLEVRHI